MKDMTGRESKQLIVSVMFELLNVSSYGGFFSNCKPEVQEKSMLFQFSSGHKFSRVRVS